MLAASLLLLVVMALLQRWTRRWAVVR